MYVHRTQIYLYLSIYRVCIFVVCVFIACCMMYGACFVCVSANECMCVRHITNTVHRAHVCMCIYIRMRRNEALLHHFSLFLSVRFILFLFFCCCFISIELAINAEPLFSFRIKPIFFLYPFFTKTLFFFCYGIHPLL